MATVSIITPFRDAEAHLADAIASVQAQTFADWELLLVDDRSSDSGPAIATATAAGDARIRRLATQGDQAGAAAARNVGLAAATGEFVAFLDADDLFEPGKLAFEVQLLSDHPQAAMAYGPALWWCDEPAWSRRESMAPFAGALHPAPQLFTAILMEQRGQVPCTCAVLIRRSALDQVGGFEEALSLYEDQTLWAKLLLRFPVYVHDEITSRYRQHEGSASARAAQAGDYDRLAPHAARPAFLAWVEDYLAQSGLASPALSRAVRLAFAPYPEHRGRLTPPDRLLLWTRQFKSWLGRRRRRLARLLGR